MQSSYQPVYSPNAHTENKYNRNIRSNNTRTPLQPHIAVGGYLTSNINNTIKKQGSDTAQENR